MASLMLALQLLVLVSSVSAWSYHYSFLGGSVTFTPKGQNSDGTYAVELRNKQTNKYCSRNGFRCESGNCGTKTESSFTTISQNSYAYNWCHLEIVTQQKIYANQPFVIRYPNAVNWHNSVGYWTSNTRSTRAGWTMAAHFDLGTRSDTGESNRSPTITSTPPLRITQNCPRRYSLLVFDHDGDQVRCRFGASTASECSLCYQPEGFSLDQNSCTLSYTYTHALGTSAFELIVEDFPSEHITVSYSDRSYTYKNPFVGGRHKRDVTTNTTLPLLPLDTSAAVTTTTTATTRAATTTDATTTTETTTAEPTTTTTTTAAPTTETATSTTAEITTATSTPAIVTSEAASSARTASAATASTTTAASTAPAATTTAVSTTPASTSTAASAVTASTNTAASTAPAATTTAVSTAPASTSTAASTVTASTSTAASTAPAATSIAASTAPASTSTAASTAPAATSTAASTTPAATTTAVSTAPASTSTAASAATASTSTDASTVTASTSTAASAATASTSTAASTVTASTSTAASTVTAATTTAASTAPAATTTAVSTAPASTSTAASTAPAATTTAASTAPAATTTAVSTAPASTSTAASTAPAATTTAASTAPTATTTAASTAPAATSTAASTAPAATTTAASTAPAATTTAASTATASTSTAASTAPTSTTTAASTATAATTTAEPTTTAAFTTAPSNATGATTTAVSSLTGASTAATTSTTTTAARIITSTTTAATTASPTAATAANATTAAATTATTVRSTRITTAATTTAAPTTTAQPTTSTLRTTRTTRLYHPSIAPLSKLPLQFSVHVDSHHAASCLDGDYFPIFLSPTPRNGVNLLAFVNHTLEIRVRATAKYTSIYGLIVSGPAGTSKHKISTEEYTIKWTPTENEVNDHFPFCFYFEARDGHHRVYQSELRCVVADVGHYDTTVYCSATTMKVEVEKSYLIRRNEKNLHLKDFSDADCSLKKYSNKTHLVAIMSLNTCGTTLEEDGDNLVFKNEITSADPNEVISRQHDVEIVFSCVYPKRTNLTLGFKHKNPYAFTEKGFSTFTFQFEFFETQRFRKQKDASTYPVEVDLKQMIFMQIEATTSIPNTELFVESCRATPYDNPNSRISYTIIERGCVKDSTVQTYPSSKTQFRFGMEAFEFIGAYPEVYITCSVILCEIGIPGTRCSQGCISSGHHRGKREAVAQTSSHSISQGPLHLVKLSDSQVSVPRLNLASNLLLISTCLLACGGVVYHSRRSKAKYQMLPSVETD